MLSSRVLTTYGAHLRRRTTFDVQQQLHFSPIASKLNSEMEFSSSASQGSVKPKKKKSSNREKSLFRADRVLANRGWGSRSECHDLLRQKRVFQKLDNDQMIQIAGPKEKISMDAPLFVDGKIEVSLPPPLLRVYHKPKWVLSVMNDGKGRKHLGQLEGSIISKMHPVGRLDYDTSGLILFSSDGTLTQTLLHPSSKIQKQYQALVVGTVQEEDLREKLKQGVETSMGVFPADLVSSRPIPAHQVQATIKSIVDNLPPEYDLDQLEEKGYLFFKESEELSEVELVVEEGKHRMVRRILANSGFPVIGLKRLRLGAIHLDDLPVGASRELTEEEELWARKLLKSKR
ncbi:pseudouridine synthase [Nitzschia inconspicua]|uniref:Pseudouridine synthase n=1 Tax=Nitzschia inconspicua TaxID=303405 RepID=A0A9K3KZ71_9STRA|nr:pseudouridine synthase [Nitzschia inconspicua]